MLQNSAFFLYGEVKYSDIFGQNHVTGFAWRYVHIEKVMRDREGHEGSRRK
jgi:hypothetical protein